MSDFCEAKERILCMISEGGFRGEALPVIRISAIAKFGQVNAGGCREERPARHLNLGAAKFR